MTDSCASQSWFLCFGFNDFDISHFIIHLASVRIDVRMHRIITNGSNFALGACL